MKKNDFKTQHDFDDETMAEIAHFREVYGCKTPCLVWDKKDARWGYEVTKNG